jgi:predicted heme/steroid binding protein
MGVPIQREMQEFTAQELSKYDGSDPNVPVYVAIKGIIYDVTKSREMYTPPKANWL